MLKDLKKSDFKKHKLLGKGKSGYSWLAFYGSQPVVLKEMHNETVDYYHFSRPKIQLEEDSYRILRTLDIRIPRMLYCCHNERFLVKEYIAGATATETIIKGAISQSVWQYMLSLEQKMRMAGINIDYFPDNFVIDEKNVFYIDYELNPYSSEWDFSNWGIYFWLNEVGMRQFKKTLDASYISDPKNNGKPLITPALSKQRDNLLKEFR